MSAPRNKPALGWGIALRAVAVIVVIALPTILSDGPVVEGVWIAALLAGLVVAVIRWALDAPVRRAKAHAGAVARQQAQAEAARLAAERAIWLRRSGSATSGTTATAASTIGPTTPRPAAAEAEMAITVPGSPTYRAGLP